MTIGNTLADYAVIVYNEDGSINRGSFGRVLSPLEVALCDALDKRNTNVIPLAASVRQAGDMLRERDKNGQRPDA